MKEVIHNVRISDIPAAIQQLGLPEDMSVDLTIEDRDAATGALMAVVKEIRTHARQQGLTDAKLEELLADAS
jgi:hypothetical protein